MSYRRCTWKGNKGTCIVRRCRNRLDHGKKYCKHSPTLDEAAVHQALVKAINQQLVRPGYLLVPFEKIPFHLSTFPVPAKSWPELYSNLLERQSMLDTETVGLVAKYAANEDWDGENELFIGILRERNRCVSYISISRLDRYGKDFSQDRFHFPYCLTKYNDVVVHYVIDTIRALDKQHLQITFKGGLVVEQEILSSWLQYRTKYLRYLRPTPWLAWAVLCWSCRTGQDPSQALPEGVFMNKTAMIAHREYSDTGQTLEKLARSFFYTFPKKELSELAICRDV